MVTTGRPGLYDPLGAAKYLGISRTGLFELLKAGELPSVKIGRLRRIPASALDDYITRLQAAGEPAAQVS
ncbi:excisionase family DNA-binding protein [Kineococcus sp. SYSU DK005]|uniref:excisionase family DNA-binding protein n=1 Tax=Kineococcus sp. SYSU DK005 TaxID=3383126 RepID=UPI003D7EC483